MFSSILEVMSGAIARLTARRTAPILACAVAFSSCSGGSGVAIAPIAPTLAANQASATAVLQANGTTMTISGPYGIQSALHIPPLTSGAGTPVTVTVTVSSLQAATSSGTRAPDLPGSVPSQPLAVNFHFNGGTANYNFYVNLHNNNQIEYDASVPFTDISANYSANEGARVDATVNDTWFGQAPSCTADLNAGTTQDHSALTIGNTINVNPASATNPELDGTITITPQSPSQSQSKARTQASRHVRDDTGGSCDASTTFDDSVSPVPSAPASVQPTSAPTQAATPLPTSTPAVMPTATPLANPSASASASPQATPTPATAACTGNNGAHLYVNDDTSGLVGYALPITSASTPTVLNKTLYNVWLTFDPSCRMYLTYYYGAVSEYGAPYTGSAIASYSGAASGDPYGVVVNATGNVFIAEQKANTVIELSSISGSVIASYAVNSPYALALDASGNLYVGASGGVFVYAPPSNSLVQTILPGNNVQGLAFDAHGNLFAGGLTSNGPFVSILSAPYGLSNVTATITQGLSHPLGLAVDMAGNLYVPNYGNNTITAYAPPYSGAPFATLQGSLPDADAIGP